MAVLGRVLVVVPKLGLGQEGAEFHCLLWGTLEVACQEGFLYMQEKDMPQSNMRMRLCRGTNMVVQALRNRSHNPFLSKKNRAG